MAVNEPKLVADLLAASIPDELIPAILSAFSADFTDSKTVAEYMDQILKTTDPVIVSDLLLHVAEVKTLPPGLLLLVNSLRAPTSTVPHIHAVLAPVAQAIVDNESWWVKVL